MSESDHSRLPKDSRLKRYESLAQMIGDAENPTPIVALNRVAPEGVELFAKLEWVNPFGSVKDRAAKWMLAGLEARGELGDRTVIEPTSGSTGIALAALCALEGRHMRAVVPISMPDEKSMLMRTLGAEVVKTPEVGVEGRHPMDVAIDMALQMVAASDGFVIPYQYDNPDNSRAHYETTGPEVWAQTEGRMQETTVPGILDHSVIDEFVHVDDEDALEMARRLHCDEALLAGSSGAACIAGALRWMRENGAAGVAVAIIPDSSQKAPSYLEQMLAEDTQ